MKKSAALTPEQSKIVEERGVAPLHEVHRLASKTREAVGATAGHEATCHSDYVPDAEDAHHVRKHQPASLRDH